MNARERTRSPSRTWHVVVLVLFCAAACSSSRPSGGAVDTRPRDVIAVGSFDFAESEIIGQLYGQALRRAGVDVTMRDRVGARELVAPALRQGLIDLIPEYAGTGLGFATLDNSVATADPTATHAALVHAFVGTQVEVLDAAPAQDVNVVVVTAATAARHRLTKTSDLQPVATQLVFGGPPECPHRLYCLQGLQRVYGLAFKDFVPLDVGGPLTRQALEAGGIDVALLFSTDPHITRDGLVVLSDDKGLQPAENVTPLVRTDALVRWGDAVRRQLDVVSRQLTTDELRMMNAAADAGEPAAEIAARWLQEHVP